MKRFWSAVSVVGHEPSLGIALDGRPVKTPARAELALPTAALAEAIAEEWRGCGEIVDPRTMPLTGLANAAIDRIAPDPAAFARGLAAYGANDLLCYRAEGPAALVARQAEEWDPLLAWARGRFDVDFTVVTGVTPAAQPEVTLRQLAAAVAAYDPFRLAGLSPLVTIGGSLVTALAVAEGAVEVDVAWRAVSLDECWQAEQWGEDAEAAAALANRQRDFAAGARFLALF